MELELRINGMIKSLDVAPNESLMNVLRREGYYSVKHGCETGECGACTVLVDDIPRPGCVTLAAQVGGSTLTTVESLGSARKLHPLQEAFIDTGAIQCGFCTPGMVLSAHALLKRNPNPTEDEIRDALSGNLCRCTGYVKPVQAVQRAAAILRGEKWHLLVCLIQVRTSNHGPLDAPHLIIQNMMRAGREMIAVPLELIKKRINPPKTMDCQEEEQQHLWELVFPLICMLLGKPSARWML